MSKQACWLSFFIAVLSSLTGCSDSNQVSSSNTRQSLPDVTSTEVSSAITVVDRLHRTVALDRTPRRIVSLSPATTELLFALGAGESLVGATEYCDFPEQAKQVPRVGSGPIGTVSLEAIVGKTPDLVLCKFDTHQPLVESLERLNFKVLALGPESLDELFEEAVWLGNVLQKQHAAAELIESMKSRASVLQKKVAELPVVRDTASGKRMKKRVFYQVWSDPLMSAGKGSFIDQMLEMAGLENIVDVTAGRYPRISPELVVERNPELIFVPSSPKNPVNIESVLQRPGWQNVSAIKHRRVYLLDSDTVSRCGPRMLEALEQMIVAAQELHGTADPSASVEESQ